jgi:hypothetical protein
MSEGVIQRYLKGTRDIRVKDIALIAEALDFEPSTLMERAAENLKKS